MKKYLKFRSFEALEEGFLSRNYSFGELRLIAIVAKKDSAITTLRHAWIFKNFGVEL